MDLMGIDIAQIADLATNVATTGAIRAAEFVADDMFEYTVAIVELVYAQFPVPQ